MPIDFGKLGATNVVDTATDPGTLFNALRRAGFNYLRDVQSEVLKGWYQRRTERDLVVKMNTGSGKTVVGLLLLKSSLNENAGPAMYVTPDKYLTAQVVEEARKLGIETTDKPEARYLNGKAILVHNIWKLVNGKSKFGIDDKVALGSVVIDDAHSCLRTAEEQFTLTVPPTHDVYALLLKLFDDALKQQSAMTLLDVKDGEPTKLMVVPFWTWREKQDQVARILHPHRNDDEIKWAWPLVHSSFANAVCIIGGRGVSITSRCLDIALISSFERAKRRIYMTATLADDSSLITHLRAAPEAVTKPITPSRAADLGDRMILAPQELNPQITDDEVKKFLAWAGQHWNVVVIVPSKARADAWKSIAAQILTAENLTDGVAKMRAGRVGLTVLVNKYDGVDLPGDACRILAIEGVPEVDRWLDRDDATVLEDSETMLAKHIQRIEQGMGRGIRSNDDHCVVLLLGAKLVGRIGRPEARAKFTPATLAQLKLSEGVAAQVQGKSLADIYKDAMTLCLTQQRQWLEVSRATVAAVSYSGVAESPDRAVRMRSAYDAALIQQYPTAAAELRAAMNAEPDPLVKGWLMQQVADYTQPTNPAEAQHLLISAQGMNRKVTKPIAGVQYVRLSATRPQAEALLDSLKSRYPTPTNMVLGYHAILDDLVFELDSFRKFEAAIQQLGEHLGFMSDRPEVDAGKGPDNLWATGNQRFVIIECKNEATAAEISKSYIDKSAGRRQWFVDTYGPGCDATSVIVHPSNVVSNFASPERGLRVLTPTKLEELKIACRTLAASIQQMGSFGDIAATGRVLSRLGLAADAIANRFTVGYVMGK